MKCLILGDVHSYWSDMNITIANAMREHGDITHIIQVGDFGYGWGGKPFKFSRAYFEDDQIEYLENEIDCLWLDGNHENHDKLEVDNGILQPGWRYMPRGSILDIGGYRCLFQGGATSADKQWREPHVSWWPQENIQYGQIQRILEEVEKPIDAIFSHEHPTPFPYSDERYDNIIGQGDKDLLDVILQYFKPSYWFFGHHHYRDHNKTQGTEWFCCPIIEARQYVIWTGTHASGDWE